MNLLVRREARPRTKGLSGKPRTVHYESHVLKTGERRQHEYTKLSDDENIQDDDEDEYKSIEGDDEK